MTSDIKFCNSDSFKFIVLNDIFLFAYFCIEKFPILAFYSYLIYLAKLDHDI